MANKFKKAVELRNSEDIVANVKVEVPEIKETAATDTIPIITETDIIKDNKVNTSTAVEAVLENDKKDTLIPEDINKTNKVIITQEIINQNVIEPEKDIINNNNKILVEDILENMDHSTPVNELKVEVAVTEQLKVEQNNDNEDFDFGKNILSSISKPVERNGTAKTLYLENTVIDAIKLLSKKKKVSDSKIVNDILKYVLKVK